MVEAKGKDETSGQEIGGIEMFEQTPFEPTGS
jgi:hypothetical protein